MLTKYFSVKQGASRNSLETDPSLFQEGSLTSFANKVFFADIQMEVFDTESAILDMKFLLVSFTMIFNITFALVRRFFLQRFGHCRGHAAVDTMRRCR